MRQRAGRAGRALLLAGALLCWLLSFIPSVSAQTAMQTYVEAMQPGWNLGNTLDATPNETAWGNPLVTQELIHQIKAQGFNSIRIPVTWDTGGRVGPAPSYTIDPAWLDRVQQIVDWSLAEGLYVMLNLHHDSYWVRSMPSNHDAVLAKFNALWSQIAPRFRDYPRELHFESINEPEFDGVNDATKNALLHELNTSFFNIVRGTGGGNATRPLVLPSVVTNSGQPFLDALKATMTSLNDTNLIATVHFYGFWPFSVNIAGTTTVTDAVIADINATIDNTYNTFVADGIPVVVGELGILSHNVENPAVERGEMLKFFEIFTAAARAKGITWQLWDAGQMLNRATHEWRDPELFNYFMQGVTSRSSTGATDLVFVESGAPADVVIPLNLNGNTFVSLTHGGTPLTPGVDYTLDGNVLTLKASLLAPYSSGGYGEKAVLEANFSAGMPWKLRVRHLGTTALSAASSSKGVGLTIPAAFNGDLVATMEAKYVGQGQPYPGPAEWTSFKEFNYAYAPNYWNNTITLRREFFAATTNDPIELTFHMWSGRKLNYRLTLQPGGDIVTDPEEFAIYGDSLAADWNNWTSWAAHDLNHTTTIHSGTSSIEITPGAWGAVGLSYGGSALDTSAYKTLTFWIHGGSAGGQSIGVFLVRDAWTQGNWISIPAPAANTWRKVEIPLAELGLEGAADINRVFFQNGTGADAPTFYIDDIKLTTAYASHLVFVHGAPAPVITSATMALGVFDSPFSFAVTAINDPVTFSATGLPPGLAIDETTGVISGTPTAAGLYEVTLAATNAAGSGTETLVIAIESAPVEITLPTGNSPFSAAFNVAYDGTSQGVDVTTSPVNVPVTITYNGSTTAPTLPGTYQVVVTSNDPNYAGSAEGTLVITVTALVRDAPVLDGDLDGSLQLLSGESFALNSSGSVSDDLLVPGMPTVLTNGTPLFAGVVDEAGAATPTNYSLTLNSGTVVRYIVRRVDPLAMPVVTMPALPTGTRDVTLDKASQTAGDFATVHNLTLNSQAGAVAVPAGVYGSITVNGSSSILLGVTGATEPAVYQLQGLTLSRNASVQIVGPVTLKLANGATLDGTVGSAEHPEWLDWQIANGGLTVNGSATVHGIVTAPSGPVIINGTLHGRVSADRLTINGSGVLEDSTL